MGSRLGRVPFPLLAAAGAVTFAVALSASPSPALARPASAPVGVSCSNLPATSLDHAVPWPQQRLDFQRVWPITEGAGITVAVVDTGVDAQQPFLRGAVLPGFDVINGGGAADTDCDGHGTFVAGIVAGRPVPGFGFAGVAPEATIVPVRQANSTTDGTAQTLADGIRAAVDAHAQVINVSIVTAQPTLALAKAVHYAQAHDVVIVAAAGNDFSQGNAVQYPAGFPGVLAVGAVDSSGQRASFSESGPDISVVAPGANLLGPGAGGVGLVTAAGGTSFAAPFVAGVAALVRSYHPGLTAAQVIQRIEVTADHPAGTLPDPGLGWGEVNPFAAVTAVLPGEQRGAVAPARSAVPAPVRPSQASGQARTVAVEGAMAGALLAVLVLLAAGIVRRGRQRRWRPGTSPADHDHGRLAGR
jgi:membrane-anchored mycosin MYCP